MPRKKPSATIRSLGQVLTDGTRVLPPMKKAPEQTPIFAGIVASSHRLPTLSKIGTAKDTAEMLAAVIVDHEEPKQVLAHLLKILDADMVYTS